MLSEAEIRELDKIFRSDPEAFIQLAKDTPWLQQEIFETDIQYDVWEFQKLVSDPWTLGLFSRDYNGGNRIKALRAAILVHSPTLGEYAREMLKDARLCKEQVKKRREFFNWKKSMGRKL